VSRPCLACRRSLLTGPTAAAQPYLRELVFMPRSRPSRRKPGSAESGGEQTFAPDYCARSMIVPTKVGPSLRKPSNFAQRSPERMKACSPLSVMIRLTEPDPHLLTKSKERSRQESNRDQKKSTSSVFVLQMEERAQKSYN